MTTHASACLAAAAATAAAIACRPAPAISAEPAPAQIETMPAGATFRLAGREVTLKRNEILPLVENDYSRVFTYDTFENPKLRELREGQKLDEAIAPGKSEFDRQVLLLDWTFRRFRKFGAPTAQVSGALDILKAVDQGHTFFCSYYAETFVSAAASVGWIARPLALCRVDGAPGSTEHAITEIWSNEHRRWVMFDPTYALYVEKAGVPLNACEIRQEWFYHGGEGLTFVFGAERKRATVKDLPVLRGRFAGFGDLALDVQTLNKYAYLAYIPNTNLMDAGRDWGRMFITKDKLCDGHRWHTRKNPADPEREPYFPLGQAALTLAPGNGLALQVGIRTLTPNFQEFRVRRDGGEWAASGDAYVWTLHEGLNRLEVRSVNRFGVEGPASVVEVEVK